MIISLLFSQPLVFFGWAVAMILAIAVHEFSHATMATYLGDQTARLQGRLTLNPLAHLDVWGTILMLTIGFGWGKPVPFNPYNLKFQRFGPALVSLAGPISNLLMVVVGILVLKFVYPLTGLGPDNGLQLLIELFIMINAVLMIFNFIPLPPLDGSKALFAILPRRFERQRMFIEKYGILILFGMLLFLPGVFDAIFGVTLGVINWFIAL
ncbi:MAG: site-2 protease family protein [Candidatus Doudnabacteria bacterium]|nr:site-2 protease family protein [Candidatus Doudnabacteria bacterium]MCA9387441.1 site-2 protease family protein [Candidatus Andersenbacteria bacterium]